MSQISEADLKICPAWNLASNWESVSVTLISLRMLADVPGGGLEGAERGVWNGGDFFGVEQRAQTGGAVDVGEGRNLVIHVDLAGCGETVADGVGLHNGHPEKVEP